MQNTQKTAGETAQKKTKWGWGLVAMVGMVVACTFDGSLIVTFIAVAMFGLGAWLGGYMDETRQKMNNNLASPAASGERRAA